ncbi:hypothetical protein HGB13_00550 [bacterium]|nr:hypothetical protein [bacterium]
MTKEEFFKELNTTFSDCVKISEKKNADYAGDTDPFRNFKLCEFLGV